MDQTLIEEAGLRRPRAATGRGLTIAVLAVVQLMLVLDVTVVNVALPDISADLGLARTTATLVVTAYGTVFGGLVLAAGSVADRLGARRVLVVGLALFMAASLASAIATDATTLIAGRVLQGVGAALVSPAALAVLLAAVDQQARGRAMAVWGAISAVGTAVGVTVGGAVTQAWGWEWIFAINIPVGVVVLAALPFVTRPVPGTRARPDLPGGALVTAGTALVVYALITAGNDGWTAPSTLVTAGAGLAAWAAFVAVERRTAEPMLRIALLRQRPVIGGVYLMVVATGLMVGNFFLGSFVLQRAYTDSPARVGLELLPAAVAVGLGAHLAGRFLARTSARAVAMVALLVAAAGQAVAAFGTGPEMLAGGLALAGLGIGAVFVTAFTSALASAGPHDGGLRSALVSTAHELGGAFGVALLSTSAAAALGAAHVAPADFTATFAGAAVVALVAAGVAGALVPGTPAGKGGTRGGHGHGQPHGHAGAAADRSAR